MPEVTGIVNDLDNNRSFILKAAGSSATEIFAFRIRKHFSKDILFLPKIPTLMCPSTSGKAEDSHDAVYITSDLQLQDIQSHNGEYVCPSSKVRFTKQSTLHPAVNNTLIVHAYLKNGEMLTTPIHPNIWSENLTYLINLILIGDIEDLATPLALALIKNKLYQSSSASEEDPSAPGPSGTQPAVMNQSSESHNSSIQAGTLNTGPFSTIANRNLCMADKFNQPRASPSGLHPAFEPWMASTGTTPPSKAGHGTIPSEDTDTTSSEDSPLKESPTSMVTGRPPVSPRSKGRSSRRANRDKSYRQPGIRSFLTPSPPGSPIPARTPLPPRRNKRRSHRLDEDIQGHQPAHKKVIRDVNLSPVSNPSSDESKSNPEDGAITEDVVKAYEQAPIPEDVSLEIIGEVVNKDLDRKKSSRNTVDDNEEIEFINIDVDEGDAEQTAPGTSSSGCADDVTLHSNIVTGGKPKHVLIKAHNNNLTIKILAFKAKNIPDVVRCFFRRTSSMMIQMTAP